MEDLRRIKNNGLDIVLDISQQWGCVFASIQTVAMVTGASIEEVKKVALEADEIREYYPTLPVLADHELSDILESQGFINERKIIAVMDKYSVALLDSLVQGVGVRGFFHELAGFETKI